MRRSLSSAFCRAVKSARPTPRPERWRTKLVVLIQATRPGSVPVGPCPSSQAAPRNHQHIVTAPPTHPRQRTQAAAILSLPPPARTAGLRRIDAGEHEALGSAEAGQRDHVHLRSLVLQARGAPSGACFTNHRSRRCCATLPRARTVTCVTCLGGTRSCGTTAALLHSVTCSVVAATRRWSLTHGAPRGAH